MPRLIRPAGLQLFCGAHARRASAGIEQSITQKLRLLPPERIIEVEDFVDFLQGRDLERNLVKQAGQASEAVFTAIWDNPDDIEYDGSSYRTRGFYAARLYCPHRTLPLWCGCP